MSEQGMVEGFRFTLDRKALSQHLPMNRRMFFRHSMVECHPSSSPGNHAGAAARDNAGCNLTSCQEDRVILSLLLRQNEVKDKLVQIMQKLYKVSRLHGPEPSLCMSIYPCSSFFMQ
jgi:hypothetical protein